MKTAVYLRVSSTDQTTASQKAEILDWLARQGLSADSVAWYEDAETGKTMARPAMRKLRSDIDAGAVETVIVQRLDRLSRRLVDGLTLLADWANRGIRIVAVRQQVDMSGPVGRLIAAVLLGVAEMELELRRERQRAGIEVARHKGVYTGRKQGTFKASPARARELRAQGLKVHEIATALGISSSCVRRYTRARDRAHSQAMRD